jgi:hypothetical protein
MSVDSQSAVIYEVKHCSGVLFVTSDDRLPQLPSEFQGAFELAKAKADLKYAARADAFPHHPQFAEPALHRITRIQEEFFDYCDTGSKRVPSGTLDYGRGEPGYICGVAEYF